MAQTDYSYFLNLLPEVSSTNFEEISLELFRYQVAENAIYHKYTGYLGIQPGNITSLDKIPFIPVDFFKRHLVKTGSWEPQNYYTSSGTTGSQPSRHAIRTEESYLANAERIFRFFYGAPEDYHIFGLLPSYLDRAGSSLIAMVDHLIKLSKSEFSGFFLRDHDRLISEIHKARSAQSKKIFLIGVTFALLDLSEEYSGTDLSDAIIMETGGMKGRREELTRVEVHEKLKSAFSAAAIHSEYGMTEMFSQAYSKGEGLYSCGNTMKVILRDPNDPLDISVTRKRGAINVIDLANIHSCAFLATDDLGTLEKSGEFRVLGRLDNSDIRGCNLMIE